MERSRRYKLRRKKGGMHRKEINFDDITYKMLLELVERSGYDIETGELSKGIRGVLLQLIATAYRKRDKIKWDSAKQQNTLLAREAKSYLKEGASYEKIAKLWENRNEAAHIFNELPPSSPRVEKNIRDLITKYAGESPQIEAEK